MVKAFGVLTTRRLTLGALLGGALRLPRLADAEAKKVKHKSKCRPACTACTFCQKGKAKKTRSGKGRLKWHDHVLKRATHLKQGTCLPKPAGTPCAVASGGRGTCHAGTCVAGGGGCTGGLTDCNGV